MPVFQGQVNGSISTIPFNIPCEVVSGYFTNRSSGNVILNVYVATESGDRAIVPINTTLVSGTQYILDVTFLLKANYYLMITTNQPLDYYISIK